MREKKQLPRELVIAWMTSLLAVFYIYPLHGEEVFRISFGVVAIAASLLVFTEVSPIPTGMLAGLFTMVLRMVVDVGVGREFFSTYQEHFPTLIFYICFSGILHLYQKFGRKDSMPHGLFWVFMADLVANVLESLIRGNSSLGLWGILVVSALLRTGITTVVVLGAGYFKKTLQHEEERRQWARQNQMVSEIYAEMFYLKKSSQDIENVMNQSYHLYQSLPPENPLRDKALEIARGVHEIRKDYLRAIDGFDGLFSQYESKETRSLQWIFSLMENNLRHVLQQNSPKIALTFFCEGDCAISRFYDLFVIVNNLLVNAVDACGDQGWITVRGEIEEDALIITVADGGSGIAQEDLPYLFHPGYTTKFEEQSGKASTGIGLCHVQNLVEELQGQIAVESREGRTVFTVLLPIRMLDTRGEDSYGKDPNDH